MSRLRKTLASIFHPQLPVRLEWTRKSRPGHRNLAARKPYSCTVYFFSSALVSLRAYFSLSSTSLEFSFMHIAKTKLLKKWKMLSQNYRVRTEAVDVLKLRAVHHIQLKQHPSNVCSGLMWVSENKLLHSFGHNYEFSCFHTRILEDKANKVLRCSLSEISL